MLAAFLTVLGCVSPSPAGDERPYFFYRALPYGTQAAYNPLNVVINGGYGILQIPGYEEHGRRVSSYNYREWGEDVWETAGHPIKTLDAFGWKPFLTEEVIPSTLSMNNNQWVPNYFLHGIGAGMHFRKTEEWYRYHLFPHPRLLSLSTMTAYHVLSEVVENRGNKELTVDHLADLLIFDPLGILVFCHDGACRFFSEKLQLQEWSMQPAIDLRTGNLENMGQFYVVKYPVSRDSTWFAMVHFGLHGTAGFTRRFSDGKALSLTGGFMVENLLRAEQEGEGRALKAVLTWRAGAFYDRNNSLLFSLMLAGIPESRVRVNVYPGLLRLGPFSPGLFVSGTKEWAAGASVSYAPLGVAASF